MPPVTCDASVAGLASFEVIRRRLSGCAGEGVLERVAGGCAAVALASIASLVSAMACVAKELPFPRFIAVAACGPVRRTTSRASDPCTYCIVLPSNGCAM